MKFAGNVVSRLGQRLLIVESDAGQLPPLYTEVADEQSRSVGKIVDLYGSVFKTVSDCVMQHRFVCRCACRRQTVCHRRNQAGKTQKNFTSQIWPRYARKSALIRRLKGSYNHGN